MYSGFSISVVCMNHSMANYMTSGSFLPLIICSGKFLFYVLKTIAYGLYGFSISIIVYFLLIFTFLIYIIIIIGSLWPVEAMPKVLRWISYALPLTVPSISMRAIIEKGFSIEEPEVFIGFLIITTWTLIFIAICIIHLKIKST